MGRCRPNRGKRTAKKLRTANARLFGGRPDRISQKKMRNTVKISTIELQPGAALAPMAGFTDAAQRRLAANWGANFTVSEMVSAKALTLGDKKSRKLIQNGENCAPYGVQLFGAQPDVMGEAARLLEDEKFDFFDINMGCPAPKITGSGAGSSLLKDPALAGQVAEAVVKAAGARPVTVKLRLGWDMDSITAVEVARRCEAAGAALLALHGRTRAEMYHPGIHPDEMAKVKAAVKIPVLANGDIDSAEGAKRLLDETGCDGVMIGRGALGAPWLFAQVKAMLEGREIPAAPGLAERMALLRWQICEMIEEKGEYVALSQARSSAIYYMRGLKHAPSLRRQCCTLKSLADLDELIARVMEENAGM